MLIYIVSFFFNMVLGLLLLRKSKDLNKKIYLWITTLQFGLLAGFRGDVVGHDTIRYIEIFSLAPETIFGCFNGNKYVDIGFNILCASIKMFGGTYQVLFIITSLFIVGSCCIFIYRHSVNVVLSIFLVVSFPFYYTSFDIVRHFMSISFLLLGFKYILKREFFKYILFVLIGSLFHKFVLLFIPFYFITYVKFSILTGFIISAFSSVMMINFEKILFLMNTVFGRNYQMGEYWVGGFNGGLSTMVMYLLLFLIVFMAAYNLKKKFVEVNVALWCLFLLFLSSVYFINIRMMIRVLVTFIPFMAIFIPMMLDGKQVKNGISRNVMMCFIIMIGVCYHAFMLFINWQNIVPYFFYWEC